MGQDDWQARAEEMRRAVLAAFPFETVRAPGSQALARWEQLRGEGRGWPIVIGGEENFAIVAESLQMMTESGHAGAAAIAAAATLRFPEDMRARRAVDLQRMIERTQETNPDLARQLAAIEVDEEMQDIPHGAWESGGSAGLSVAQEFVFDERNSFMRPHAEVVIALLPVDNGADAIGMLGFGGWNECPFPAEHVAAWRRWHAQYGVEVVGVSNDVINARARTRPATREEAMALALEQFEYCTDIVHQGVGTIEALAATLMAEDWWYFWWD
jgi:hypothetical protein